MTTSVEIKQQVREFYDQVGWQEIGEGVYQNARYEDLRPVSREYIHYCHLRAARHLRPIGEYFLDAGSGPIQYPEYLEYSRGYHARVCADISMLALQEARRRIGDRQEGGHGLFVVADVANLPFKANVFDGIVSLHTIHHLPADEHGRAYGELFRVLAPQSVAVVVNGWVTSPLMRPFATPIRWIKRLRRKIGLTRRGGNVPLARSEKVEVGLMRSRHGTFVSKKDAAWLKREIGSQMLLEIRVWRTVSVGFLRTFIHPFLGGRYFLRLLFWLEERYPRFFGENGQYPLVVISKG